MKYIDSTKSNRSKLFILLIIIVTILSATLAYANSAELPGFTVIVYSPPSDLSIFLHLEDDNQTDLVILRKDQKAWETYYRFFYRMSTLRTKNLDNAVLSIQSDEKNFECALPASTFDTYNNMLTLDLKHETLTVGQPILRLPLLISLRVVSTLLIEGLIFFIFGYRQKASWIAFFVINLITQSGLNLLLAGPNTGYLWMFAFLFVEFIVLISELIAFTLFVNESEKSKVIVYVIVANLMSLIVGGTLISYLPI